jgi:hypothetical protein
MYSVKVEKGQTLVVHGVHFSLDTSDFHKIAVSCQIFESGKYSDQYFLTIKTSNWEKIHNK